MAVNGAPVQRDYEYGNRQYMLMNYGRRPYGQPVYAGGMPGRPRSPLGDMVLRWTFYAIVRLNTAGYSSVEGADGYVNTDRLRHI